MNATELKKFIDELAEKDINAAIKAVNDLEGSQRIDGLNYLLSYTETDYPFFIHDQIKSLIKGESPRPAPVVRIFGII